MQVSASFTPLIWSMSLSQPGENHQRALDRFLVQHPDVAAELNSLNPLAAQAKGETIEQYRAAFTAAATCPQNARATASNTAPNWSAR